MLEGTPEQVMQQAKDSGVSKAITIGTEAADLQYVLDVSAKLYPDLYCTLGVHPHHGSSWTEEIGNFIRKNANEPTVVAVGEIGLDYFYKQSPIDEQKSSFRRQMELAEELNLPVQIHTREAEADTIEILQDFSGRVKGVIHCFTSSEDLAKRCLDFGFNISFSGVLTFKNADSLRKTCQMVPLDRLHVETDAPFLAPVPMRGKKNTPAFVIHTAKFLADLKGISEMALAEHTNENARQLFPKIIW
jgi:TatD DNase family protein